jgi:hypothetical protein
MSNRKHPLSNSNASAAAAIEGAIRNAQNQPHNVRAYEAAMREKIHEALRQVGGFGPNGGKR